MSRRWKSADQTGSGGLDQASNRYTSVKIPAKDERVLTPWLAPDSLAEHSGPDGSLTPERRALHEKIISDALAGAERSARPVATFMGGGPATASRNYCRCARPAVW